MWKSLGKRLSVFMTKKTVKYTEVWSLAFIWRKKLVSTVTLK